MFLAVVAFLGAAAGTSVLIRGKSAKPKARAVMVSKPAARLEEIKAMLDPAMPEDVRAAFLENFKFYTSALESGGSGGFDRLVNVSEELSVIEQDGIITGEEASQWTETASKALKAEQ